MRQYADLVNHVLTFGTEKADRTGTGTKSVFGYQQVFDLREGFPILTTKRVHWKSVVEELLWFLRGATHVASLREKGVTIWDEWADADGNVGPIYGAQWRGWLRAPRTDSETARWIPDPGNPPRETDQIAQVINALKTDPDSRRMVVSAWNVGELDQMALPPCHMLFQFYSRVLRQEERFQRYAPSSLFDAATEQVRTCPSDWDAVAAYLPDLMDNAGVPRRALSCRLDQRSADVGLGVPFNWASYALLTHIVAALTGHGVDQLIWQAGDVHIYSNHADALREQMRRTPRRLPRLVLPDGIEEMTIDEVAWELTADDFQLVGYDPHPAIKLEVAV